MSEFPIDFLFQCLVDLFIEAEEANPDREKIAYLADVLDANGIDWRSHIDNVTITGGDK